MNPRCNIWGFMSQREFESRIGERERRVVILTLANREPSSTAVGDERDGGSTSQGVPTPGLLDLDAAWPCSSSCRERRGAVSGRGEHHSSSELETNHRTKILEGD